MYSRWTLSHKEGTEQGRTSSNGGFTSSEPPGVVTKGRQVAPPRLMLNSLEAEFALGWKELLKCPDERRGMQLDCISLEDIMGIKKRKVKEPAYI